MGKREIKPPSDAVAGQNYQYLDLPKSMEECFYDLELIEFKAVDSKFFAVFKVLDTDTKVKKGAEISHQLDPFQKFAETYFWRDLFNIYLTTRGREATKDAIEDLKPKHKKILKRMEEGAGVGGSCKCTIESYAGEDGERKTKKSWEPLGAADEG